MIVRVELSTMCLYLLLCGPLLSSVYECAFTSPVRTERGMFAVCSVVYPCQLFAIVICLVLLMCTFTI